MQALAQQCQIQLEKPLGIPLRGENVPIFLQNRPVYINLVIRTRFQGQGQLAGERHLGSVGVAVGGEFRGQSQRIPLGIGQGQTLQRTALLHETQKFQQRFPQRLFWGLFLGGLGFLGGFRWVWDFLRLGLCCGFLCCGLSLRDSRRHRFRGDGADGGGDGLHGGCFHRGHRGSGCFGGIRRFLGRSGSVLRNVLGGFGGGFRSLRRSLRHGSRIEGLLNFCRTGTQGEHRPHQDPGG